MLSDHEFIRYSRSLMLGEDGEQRQLALRQSRVLVIGLGGLGAQLTTSLVASGVGQLWLFDPDRVELSNLPRQPLYQSADIGRYKTDVALKRLAAMNPAPALHGFRQAPTDTQLLELLPTLDLVLDCSDNTSTRLQLNRLCRQQHKPLMSAAVSGQQAQLYLVSQQGPCYQCLFGGPLTAEASGNEAGTNTDNNTKTNIGTNIGANTGNAASRKGSQHDHPRSSGALPNCAPALQNCRTLGVDPALVLLAAQQLAWLALQYLQGQQVPWDHYGFYRHDASLLGFRLYPLAAEPACACCAASSATSQPAALADLFTGI